MSTSIIEPPPTGVLAPAYSQGEALKAQRTPTRHVIHLGQAGESAFLKCAKLTALNAFAAEPPRVVLLAPEVTPTVREFAEHAGATAVLPEWASQGDIDRAFGEAE